jgi:hypothetical protein
VAVAGSLCLTHLVIWTTGYVPSNITIINVMSIISPALIAPPMIYWHCAAIQQIVRQRKELAEINQQLTSALAEVRELSGLLPVCAWCHKLRDDQGYWSKVDSFLERHTRAEITHSVCPDCMAREISQFKCERPSV